MKASDVPLPKDGVLFREIEDGCVLYDPRTEKVHSLNVTAGFIWCLIDGERSLGDIAGEISSASGEGGETVLRDVISAADEFARQGLFA